MKRVWAWLGAGALRWPIAVSSAALLLHSLIAVIYPLPGSFRKYSLAAEQILSGELPRERLMDFSPAYLQLHLVAERWLPWPEKILEGLQVLLAALSVGLLFVLLRRRVGLPLALAGAAVLTFEPHLLVYERILEPEVGLLFGVLAVLVFLERAGPRNAVLAGLFAAVCLATRPTFLPAFAAVPFYYWWRGDRGKTWLRRSISFLAPVASILLLLALRADAVTGNPRTPLMNPGTVFFEGNNPLSQGTSAIYPPLVLGLVRHSGEIPDSAHHFYRVVARAEAGRELSISEVNAYWSSRAMAFIRAEPVRFSKLLRAKLARAFHGFRWHDVPLARTYEGVLFFLPAFPFAILAALAIVGTLLEVGRWRESLIYYALGLSQLGVMLAFYVSARQRLVLLPAFLFFAAVAVERLLHTRRRAWPLWLLTSLLALSLSLPNDWMRDEVYRHRAAVDTERLLDQVRQKSREQPLALHAELAVEAVAASPWWLDWLRPAYFPRDQGTLEERVARRLASAGRRGTSADFDLAAVHLEAGQLAAARQLLEPLSESAVYRGGQQPSEPLILLGRIAALEGNRERAVELLEGALERSPGNSFALAELVALTQKAEFQQELDRYWGRLDAQFLIGRALLAHGDFRNAASALNYVVRRLPEHRDARVLLAAALGASGYPEEGARHYLQATEIRLEPLLASRQIVALFRNWAEQYPDVTEVQLYTAQVLHQHGFFDEALARLEGLEVSAELALAVEQEKSRIRRARGAGNSSSSN